MCFLMMDTMLRSDAAQSMLVTMIMWIAVAGSRERDICNLDTFNPSCNESSVLVIEEALYGRMAVGSCIPEVLRSFTGCQVDVLDYLHSVCSGRQTCQLSLPDNNLAKRRPCQQRGVESYLHLKYSCVKVYNPPAPCTDQSLPVPGPQGVLANAITGRTGHGSQACPYVIRGTPGQKIRFTIQSYWPWTPVSTEEGGSEGRETGTRVPDTSGTCHIHARITEDGTDTQVILCGSAGEKVTYVSQTEGVQIALSDPKHSENPVYFLLYYKAIGCLDFVPPEGAVTETHGDEITVRCPETGREWRVTCDGTRWAPVGNCTGPVIIDTPPLATRPPTQKGGLTLAHVLLMIIIISVAVLIAVVILGTAVVCLRRKRQAERVSLSDGLMDLEVYPSHSGYTTNLKEKQAMLGKTQDVPTSLPCTTNAQSVYTTTLHRHMAVPPGVETPGGGFRFQPPPPRFSPPPPPIEGAASCSCDVTTKGRHPRDGPRGSSKQSHDNYKHGSPDLLQTARAGRAPRNHFYHELDPEHFSCQKPFTSPPQEQTDSVTEAFDLDSLVAPPAQG